MIMHDMKNIVHAIFPAFEPHGDEYLLLCKHYASKLNWQKYLEPIIDQKTLIHDENWRKNIILITKILFWQIRWI